jgi:hypothetical protein
MLRRGAFVLTIALCLAPGGSAYSVLTHEAIIDSAWTDSIEPLLRQRFPAATPEELAGAHAYTYGGAIIQDMGYYPFGSHFFSDLTHYVRSGDFVLALLDQSQDLNEYAFALGALAHHAADTAGHSLAVNRAVPVLFPILGRKFGASVTYAQDAVSHVKTEFAFDVVQVAQGHYAPQAYHEFIGFEIAQRLLEQAFEQTYGLEFADQFLNEDLALGSYRYAVSSLIPHMTRTAWALRKDDIRQSQPGVTRRKFVYNLSRQSYHQKWGNVYERPGFGTRCLAFLFRLIPKAGPLRAFGFQPPTPAAEAMFIRSFDSTLDHYRALLAAHRRHELQLPNHNLDTGQPLKPGAYSLADDVYAHLVDRVSKKPISAELRSDILGYYADLQLPYTTKQKAADWQKLVGELEKFKQDAAGVGGSQGSR